MGLLPASSKVDAVEHMNETEQSEEILHTKGKGKEKENVGVLDGPPRYLPYLTNQHNISQRSFRPPWVDAGDPRAVLNERLRVLRDVDEIVWDLVGELTRLGSAWDVEDSDIVHRSVEVGEGT